MGSEFEDELFQRLDRYVRIDTQSDADVPVQALEMLVLAFRSHPTLP